ncbi:MAG: hypothetical protein GXY44_00060 [Phycisphaerales bacterium]|nr:hypothetical protein [Phycisphaerales bacterium]
MQLVNKNPSAVELHKFGWAMLAGFGLIGGLLWYVGPEPNSIAWVGAKQQKIALGLWVLGAVLLVISFGPRGLARPVYVCWMSTAMLLGSIMTVALLSFIFVVLLPFFSLIRLGDPLHIKLAPEGESYWEEHVHHDNTLERMSHPY